MNARFPLLDHVIAISSLLSIIICLQMQRIESAKSNSKPKSKSTFSFCQTKECHKIANTYKEELNFAVSPCDDFASFTCGKFVEKQKIADNSVEASVVSSLAKDVEKKTIEVLEGGEVETPRTSTENARAVYQGCVAGENVQEDVLSSEVHKVLKDLGGMPMLPDSHYKPEVDWPTRVADLIRQFNIPLILGFGISSDFKNASSKSILFCQAMVFGLSRANMVGGSDSDKAIIDAFKKYIKTVICILRKDKCKQANTIEEDINKMIDFLKQLAKITSSPEEQSQIQLSAQRSRKTLKELKKMFPDIQWMQILNEVFKETDMKFDENYEVAFEDPKFYSQLPLLMNKTDKGTVANFFGWAALDSLQIDYTNVMKSASLEFIKVYLGYEKLPDVKKGCSDFASSSFPLSVGRLYIEKYFPSKVKSEIEDIVKNLIIAMKTILTNVKWMDDVTRQEALKKLEKIEYQIGYMSWIKDNDKRLEDSEGLPEPFDKKNYIGSLRKYVKSKVSKELRELKKLSNKYERSAYPGSVNAYYIPKDNIIVFLAGILQPPVYQPNTLKSLNYGSTGTVIGHEFTHAFDDTGSQFDGDGTIRNWWTNATKNEFNKRKQCFVDLYSQVTDNQTSLKLNGALTVGENIADNGAIQEAYDAYMLTNPADERLPGLSNLTHQQLFFISFGRLWCGKFRTTELRRRILTDVHTPSMYRVVVVPRNSMAFSEAFQCPPGSPMNPSHKCKMW